MNQHFVQLVDQFANVVAVAQVADKGAYYGGTVDLSATPAELRRLFEEFDEIVNGQMFSFLDEIEERIAAQGIRGAFDDGRLLSLKDLQLCPSTGDIAFKIAGIPLADPKACVTVKNGSVPERHQSGQTHVLP